MVILSNGGTVNYDLYKLTLEEYRALFSTQNHDIEDPIMARVVSMTVEEYRGLPYPDWRRLMLGFFEEAKNPIKDPNSQSESTSISSTETARPLN